jgi:hypothetical protein
LKTSVFESIFSACIEALLLFALVEEFSSSRSLFHITVWMSVDKASDICGISGSYWSWSQFWQEHDGIIKNALVNVDFTIRSCESRYAEACVFIDTIFTDSSVLAWLRSALVNVGFTVLSSESRQASACV